MASASSSSSGCTRAAAAGLGSPVASRLRPQRACPDSRAIGRRPLPGFACRGSSSLFEPPTALQHVSAPGGAARSEPCPTSPLEPPARYALGAATPLCAPAASRQRTTRGQRTRQLLLQPSIAFPLEAGSPSSLAPDHRLDVGPLFGPSIAPVSDSLRDGICFLQHPLPLSLQIPLRFSCPSWATDRGFHLPLYKYSRG